LYILCDYYSFSDSEDSVIRQPTWRNKVIIMKPHSKRHFVRAAGTLHGTY
jgi:hypothetical protein